MTIFISCKYRTNNLIFIEDDLTLGEVKIQDSLKVSFNYLNDSQKDISIINIQSSCDCIINSLNDSIIKKGSKGRIDAYYVPDALGKFEKNIVLRTTSEKEFYSLNFRGTVVE